MSQSPIPPAPPSYPPPPPPPPYGSGNSPAGARLGNGMAVASLVMGIMVCIPVLTGLGGILFGVLGLKKTRDPRVGGKGLAITGILLGVLNLALWGLFGGGVWALVAGTSLQRDLAKTFIKDMSEGNVTAAAGACDSTMPKAALESSSAAMKAWGALKDVTTVGINANAAAGRDSQVVVSGVAEFANAKRQFVIQFVKEGGNWKIVKFEFPEP